MILIKISFMTEILTKTRH